MSENPTSPLLGGEEVDERPKSQRSKASVRSKRSQISMHSEESTPLLSRENNDREYGSPPPNRNTPSPDATSLRSIQDDGEDTGKSTGRWPTIVALSLLGLIIITILGLGFAAPAVVEEYAKDAMVFEPTDLSIDSITSSGVKARVQGDFTMDASRVHKKPVRDLGRAGTWIAEAVESKPSKVDVYLPELGNLLLGTASVPRIVVDVRNGHTTHIDFITDLEPGDVEGIRRVAKDWIDGRLGQLRVEGQAKVGLKSGLFNLGTRSFSETLLFKAKDIPAMPKYNITRLNFHEVELPDSDRAMATDVSLVLHNDYPVTFTVPQLGFDILVPNCAPEQPSILLANAITNEVAVSPKEEVHVNVTGIIRQLPEVFTAVCPDSGTSPLDILLGQYISGRETTIFVRGAEAPSPDTPRWISDLIQSVVVPVPFPGHSFDNLIKDFSLNQVHLGLPDPFADPNTPEAQPKISAVVEAQVNLPNEMNFPIDISRVRANATVFYHGKQLGLLDLRKWQSANSTRVEAHGDEQAGLVIESIVKEAPLEVTDDDVFAKVVEALIFGGKSIVLDVKTKVDVETVTALGKFIIRDIPAEGKVPIKPISGSGIESFTPEVGDLKILETTISSLLVQAKVNVTNPTNYSATVPYVNINLLSNGTLLGQAIAKNVNVVPGRNDNIRVTATWEALSSEGKAVGRELLSQYISGYNTTLTLQTHSGTIPTQPRLGAALSSLAIEIPTPKLKTPRNPNHPDGEDDEKDPKAPHFIDDATFHLITSTATFTLLSPLPHTTIFITSIDATAFYNHTEAVGEIIYDLPFAVPPGASTSPRLPVDWSLGSVGYEAVKQALGGSLKLDAKAMVGIRVGKWQERVWFTGSGIGAHIKI